MSKNARWNGIDFDPYQYEGKFTRLIQEKKLQGKVSLSEKKDRGKMVQKSRVIASDSGQYCGVDVDFMMESPG